MNDGAPQYDPISFADLPGWADDDHLAAFRAFQKSCSRIIKVVRNGHRSGKKAPDPGLLSACFHAGDIDHSKMTRADARSFFERHFAPHRVVHQEKPGLMTGYYEPVIEGSRTRTKEFSAPVYERPRDLVNLVDESQRGAVGNALTHARKVGNKTIAFPTRKEIDQGALKNLGLELLFLRNPVELFFLQVQGSGRIKFQDGTYARVTYDGKNGHPYTSIGQYLIDTKKFPAHRMSLAALGKWLMDDTQRGLDVMWKNASYVFFREIAKSKDEGALGVMSIPLSPGRSLAVDGGYHAMGTPVYVSSPDLKHATGSQGFHRLMVAQDVGSAIKGPERGDIYFGSGDKAGQLAGVTKHKGNFFVMLPALHDGDQIVAGETEPRAVRQAQR